MQRPYILKVLTSILPLALAITGQPYANAYQIAEPQPEFQPTSQIASQTSPQNELRQALGDTVKFDLYGGTLIVVKGSSGRLKGLNFLIDTGASPTVLDPRLAKKLRLQKTTASIAVLGGRVQAEKAIVPDLELGPARRDRLFVSIKDLSFLEQALSIRIDAEVGLDVLGQSPFVIDYSAHEIRFVRPTPPPTPSNSGGPTIAQADHAPTSLPTHLSLR